MKSLKDLRIEKGAFQGTVAKAIGSTVASVSSWETGKTSPLAPMVPKLAKYFGVSTQVIREAIEESKRQGELAAAGKE